MTGFLAKNCMTTLSTGLVVLLLLCHCCTSEYYFFNTVPYLLQGGYLKLQQNFKIPPYGYQLSNSCFSTFIMKFHLHSLKSKLDGDIDSNRLHVMGDERWRPFFSNVHYSTSNCDPNVASP